MFEQNVDLKDFCQRLLKATGNFKDDVKVVLEEEKDECFFVEKLKERCQDVSDAVDVCVLESGFSGGAYQFSNGISIFFPWTYLTYLFSEKSYKVLKFANDGGKYWNAFLLHFLRDVTLRGKNIETGKLNPILNFPINKEEGKISENPANKISENPANKISENPANKIIENAANRISENPANKISENPANKIMDSPTSRMLGTMGSITADFKNIAMPWDVAGYKIDKSSKSQYAGSDDGGEPKKSD